MDAVRYICSAVVVLVMALSCQTGPGSLPVHGEIEILNREAFDLRYKDFALSKKRAEQAAELAGNGNPAAKAEAWNHIAYTYFMTSQFDSTRYYLDMVRNIEGEYTNRDIEEAITYITEARVFLRECKYAEAFRIYDTTITIFRGGFNRLKYNDRMPLKKYGRDRYYLARSDYLLGNAVLGYYYRDTELPVILASLDKIEKNEKLHIDTTQLSVLYYTYAGAYEKGIAGDVENYYNTLDYIEKGLDLLADPSTRNDYYLANFYQITGSLLRNESTWRWMSGPDSTRMKSRFKDVVQDRLTAKYGWRHEDVYSGRLPLFLLERADSLFLLYDDPYQHLTSGLHMANYILSQGDTLSALPYYSRAIRADSTVTARGGYARIWTKRLYRSLLSNVADRFDTEDIQRWFDIYAVETDIIAEYTKRDYDAQKGKAEAEAIAKRSLNFVFIILGVCIAVLVLLYFLGKQNKKLHRARVELKTQNEELDTQYKKLHFVQKKLIEQKRMELLTYVVRGISHELSQPLGSITQTLYDTFRDIDTLGEGAGGLPEDVYRDIVNNIKSDLSTIAQSKDAISDLVNSFRNTIKENIIDPEAEFNLSQKLEDIITVIKPNVKSNINLVVDCDRGLVIRSFPLLFSQVVTNLISNANQHAFPDSDDPGDTIKITCRKVGRDLHMNCSDNGIGIPEHELDRLCQPFVSKKQENLGLGLSLVKNIVEQYMKGEITFMSGEGEGLTVAVVIPDCVTEG